MNSQDRFNPDIMAIKDNIRLLVASMINNNFASVSENISYRISSVVTFWIFSIVVDLENRDYVQGMLLLYAKDVITARLSTNRQLPLVDLKYSLSREEVDKLEKIIPFFASKREDLLSKIDAEIRIGIGMNLRLEEQ